MYRHVLVALDGRATCERVLPWVRRIAPAPGGVVRLLTTIEPVTGNVVADGRTVAYVDQVEGAARAAALAHLERVAARLREDGREAVVEVRVGDAVSSVVEAAREWRADLIAITVDAWTGARGFWRRSTVDEILRTSPVPVLLVRPRGQRAA